MRWRTGAARAVAAGSRDALVAPTARAVTKTLAIRVDGRVVSTPSINEPLHGDTFYILERDPQALATDPDGDRGRLPWVCRALSYATLALCRGGASLTMNSCNGLKPGPDVQAARIAAPANGRTTSSARVT